MKKRSLFWRPFQGRENILGQTYQSEIENDEDFNEQNDHSEK